MKYVSKAFPDTYNHKPQAYTPAPLRHAPPLPAPSRPPLEERKTCDRRVKSVQPVSEDTGALITGEDAALQAPVNTVSSTSVQGRSKVPRHGNVRFVCDFSHKSFECNSVLLMHIHSVHHRTEKLSCDCRDKLFWKKQNIRKQVINVHQSVQNFTCDYCGKSFGQKANLLKHITTVHK